MRPSPSPISIYVRGIATVTTLGLLMCGCESQPSDIDVDGGYVQSPMGYVPPHETQDQVPIQIGPQPVPLIGGAPSIRMPDQSPAIELTADQNGFQPQQITVAPGQAVTVRLTNRSTVERGLRIELPGVHASLPQDVAPGESRVIVFTAPIEPGTYVFHSSSTTDDTANRYEGRLIVRETH
jgi:FtsP/CotA-like multicopper oxidase with cupredoxin domain